MIFIEPQTFCPRMCTDLAERSLPGLGAGSFIDVLRPLLPLQRAMLLPCPEDPGAIGGLKESELLCDF